MNNLIEITMSEDDLTEDELKLLEESREYLKQKEIRRNAKTLRRARRDFEKLRDIPDMPEAAIKILQRWTFRDEDYEDDE